ncbi:MAG: RNA polymerase sigma factor [Sulfitobacter sp.]|nr:RNA polymerase sigma factor [Sulfitobacter sp.]
MFAEPKHPTKEVLRREAEAKLIECRNKFLGFLRKRLNSQQDAEDVFQDFCVKVLRNHRSINSGKRLDAWLGTTLRHTLIDHYRRRATRNRGTEAYAIETKVLEHATEEFDEPACSCIAAAMQKLEPAQAELLSRLELHDEPRVAIAADLGVNLNTLRVRAHRSRIALKKKIAEICPVCGDGRFMQCECDHSRDVTSLPIPYMTELMAKM